MEHSVKNSILKSSSSWCLKVVKKVGEGTYGKVYFAKYRDKIKNEEVGVACKIIDIKQAPPDYINKFLPRELDIILKLDHPNIISVKRVLHTQNRFFILMRYAEIGDLLHYISSTGILKENNARIWTKQISCGLKFLHDNDIAHRDLKCENILITKNFNVKLADFGFATTCVDSNNQPRLSETFCGSLLYAAPEILRGKPYEPKKTDIWSLGIITFAMLNGTLPFQESHARNLYRKQINNAWSFRNHVVGKLSDYCIRAVQNMLQPKHSKRINIDEVLKLEWLIMKFERPKPVAFPNGSLL